MPKTKTWRPSVKMKTLYKNEEPHENKDPLRKQRPTKNEDVLRKWGPTTKITFGANTRIRINISSVITKFINYIHSFLDHFRSFPFVSPQGLWHLSALPKNCTARLLFQFSTLNVCFWNYSDIRSYHSQKTLFHVNVWYASNLKGSISKVQ